MQGSCGPSACAKGKECGATKGQVQFTFTNSREKTAILPLLRKSRADLEARE